MNFSKLDMNLLNAIADLQEVPAGAINVRRDGQAVIRQSSSQVDIRTNPENNGLVVEVKPGTRDETVHIPVILTRADFQDKVFNTFIIGEDAEVTIIAGCGIHNAGHGESRHDGIHEFIVADNARVRYVEKHYGEGSAQGKKVLNPTTIVRVGKGASVEMEMFQIRGVDDTVRSTIAQVEAGGNLKILERLMTHGQQNAESLIEINIEGENGAAQILSRSVARDNSTQLFKASLVGRTQCHGHVECDAIIMDSARIKSVPQLVAEDARAELTHEAAIGRIAGEQLTKLMSLGLSEQEAVDTILEGFLR